MVGQNEWKFPELNNPLMDPQAIFTSGLDVVENIGIDSPILASQVPDPLQNALQQKEAELAQLKHEYSERINLSNQVLAHLANQVRLIDEEVLGFINDIIRKVALRIIHQELKQDADLLPKMLRSLLDEVPEQKAPITVFISNADKEQLAEMTADNLIWQTDANLNSGDMIVKTHIAEVRAILSERIDNLLGLSHD